jgi:acyl-[acyl-carrier protein] desaturase
MRAQNHRTRRNLQLQWGAGEACHGVAWELVLHHSGACIEAQLQTYIDKYGSRGGARASIPVSTLPWGGTAYAMIQERTTSFNCQEMRARIREEYGLPLYPTPHEH